MGIGGIGCLFIGARDPVVLIEPRITLQLRDRPLCLELRPSERPISVSVLQEREFVSGHRLSLLLCRTSHSLQAQSCS